MQTHEVWTAWLFRVIMTGHALSAIDMRFALTLSDANKYDSTITIYAEVVDQLQECYASKVCNSQDRWETLQL